MEMTRAKLHDALTTALQRWRLDAIAALKGPLLHLHDAVPILLMPYTKPLMRRPYTPPPWPMTAPVVAYRDLKELVAKLQRAISKADNARRNGYTAVVEEQLAKGGEALELMQLLHSGRTPPGQFTSFMFEEDRLRMEEW